MKRFVFALSLLYSSLSAQNSLPAQNIPDTSIINQNLKHISISVPGNILLNDRRIDLSSYYFIAEPDTDKLKGKKSLVYLREGLDSLASELSADNPQYIFMAHDAQKISQQVASSIDNAINPVIRFRKTVKNVSDLIKVYPNPFNDDTMLQYTSPARSDVRISIITLLGEEIVLFQGYLEGSFSHTGSLRNRPSGIYFFKVQGHTASEEYLGTVKALKIR